MALISDTPLEYVYCVKFKLSSWAHCTHCYYRTEEYAEKAAKKYKSNPNFSNVEIIKYRVVEDGKKLIKERISR